MENKQVSKSSVLWNIQQPGDPYDIRKSMIARLPDHSQNFMGDHLELVCLLQAAQIQRLSQSLQYYKMKFKEVQRLDLDRHSYQIQIKQLAQRKEDTQTYKIQNDKLKQYLRRLNAELDQLRMKVQRNTQLQTLQVNYQSCLIELRVLRQKNAQTQNLLKAIRKQKDDLKLSFDNLERIRVIDLSSQKHEIQSNIRRICQSQTRQLTLRYQSRIREYETDIRLLRQQIQSKNHEIQSLLAKRQEYIKDIQTLNIQVKSKLSMEADYHQKVNQLARVNQILDEKLLQLEKVFSNFKILESNLDATQRQNKQLNRRIFELQKQLSSTHHSADLQKTISLLNSQFQEVNIRKEHEIRQLLMKCSQLENQIQPYQRLEISLKGKISQYQSKILQLTTEIKTKSQIYDKNRILAQQIQNLNATIRVKNEQIQTLNQRIKLAQNSQHQIIRLKTLITEHQKIILMLKSEKADIESKQQQNISKYISKLQFYEQNMPKMSNQVSKLTDTLSIKNNEIQRLNSQLQKQSTRISREQIQIQVRKRQQMFESKISMIERQHQQRLDFLGRQISQLQRQNKILHQNAANNDLRLQIQSLNQERNNLLRQNSQLRDKIQNLERNISQLVGNQSKIAILNQQIERLKSSINIKNQQINTLEVKISIFQRQSPEIISLKSQLSEKERSYSVIQAECRQLKLTLQRKINIQETFNHKISDLSVSLERLKSQNNHLRAGISKYEMQMKNHIQLENKIALLSQQIQRLISIIKMKDEKINIIEIQLSKSVKSSDLEHLQFAIKQRQQQLAKKDSQIQYLRTQNEQLQQKLSIFDKRLRSAEQNLPNLSAEIDQLKHRISALSEQNNILKRQNINIHRQLQIKISDLKRLSQTFIIKEKQWDIRHHSITTQKIEIQVRKRVQSYQHHITSLQKEKNDIIHTSNNLSRKLSGLEHQLADMSARILALEKQRNDVLYKKNESEKKLASVAAERDGLVRSIQEHHNKIRNLEGNIEEIMKIQDQNRQQYQSRLKSLSQQLRRIQDIVAIKQQKIRQLQQNTMQSSQYQIKITSLTETIHNYEEKIKIMQQQLNSSNSKIGNFNSQLREKQRYYSQLQAQLASIKERNKTLQQKYRKTDLQLLNLQKNFQQIQSVHAHTLSERDHLFKISHELQQRLENELKNHAFEEENKKLRIQLNHFTHQISILKQQNRSIVQQMHQKFKIQTERLIRQNSNFQETILRVKKQYEERLKNTENYHHQIHELEVIINKITNENNTLSQQRNQLLEENEKLNELAHEFQNKVHMMEDNQNGQLMQCTQEIARLNQSLSVQIEENQRMNSIISQRQITIHSYEEKIAIISSQLERVTKIVKSQSNIDPAQLQNLKNQLYVKTEESRQWEQKYTTLYNRFKTLEVTQINISNQNENIKKILSQYQNKMQKVQIEFDTLNKMIHEIRAENQRLRINNNTKELENKNLHLCAEIQRLTRIITSLKEQISEVRIKLTDQFALQRRVQQYMALMVILFAEIETLRSRCRQTEQQCQNVRRSSLTPFRIDKR